MADNSAAKSHLNSIESTLTNMGNINNITDLVNTTSLRLCDILGGQNLLIDSSVKDGLERIKNDLQSGGTHLGGRVKQKIDVLADERTSINTAGGRNAARVAEIGREINDLLNIANDAGTVSTNVANRYSEYNTLYTTADRFDLGSKLDDLTIDMTASASGDQNIKEKFLTSTASGLGLKPSYELCDEKGDKLTKVGSDYQVTVGGQTYTLGGIKFNGDNLEYRNVTLNPLPATLPLDIKLSINASYLVNVGVKTINVTCNKKLTISLNDGTASVGTDTERESAFDDYNSSRGGHVILDQLNTKIDIRNTDPEVGKNELERKALETALKYKGGTAYDTLSDRQKTLFYERVCNAGFFDPIYGAGGVIDTGTARYDKMKTWFVSGSRQWNNDRNIIGSASAYKTYISSNLKEKCNEYISYQLQTYLQRDAINTALKAELSKFLQEIDNSKLDTSGTTSEILRILRSNKNKMSRGPISLFNPRDVNYMRFFSGSSTSLKNQKVNIYSSLNKPEPIEYDMDLSVSGKNNVEVKITMKGTGEVIKQKSKQPSTLVQNIIYDQRIKEDKVKAHIGFNIYKAMIQIAQQKNISLTYRGMEGRIGSWHRSEETREITINKDGNIVVKQMSHLAGIDSEKDEFVFDQNTFLNKNEFDDGQTNGQLLNGINILGKHFNMAMNDLHNQYRGQTKKRWLGLRSSRSKMDLPTSKFFNRITLFLNRKTNMNFDFNTNVKSNGKNIKIEFIKNKFTITTDIMRGNSKETITLSSKDLGQLLNHREGKVRIFDGVERDISASIYSCLIDKLRKNSKIARTNFGVVDDITGNMYVLDEDGEFGMIAKERFKGRDKIANPFKGLFRGLKKSGILNKRRLDKVGWKTLDNKEKEELLRNSSVMQKFINTMSYRMTLKGSVAAKI